MRSRWLWFGIPVFALVVVAAVVLVLVRDDSGGLPPPSAAGDVGAGVQVDGASGMPIHAVKAPQPATLPYQNVSMLSDFFDVGPSGKLPATISVTLPLRAPLPQQTGVVVATAESANGPWTLLAGTPTPDRMHVRLQTDHLSLFGILGIDVPAMMEEFRRNVVDVFDGGVTAEAQRPTCGGEAAARDDGYTVASDSSDTVFWCLGKENGHEVLKVVNNRRYALAIDHGTATVLNPGRFDVVSAVSSGTSATIQPRDESDLGVTLAPTGRLDLAVSFNGPAQSVTQLVFGVRALLAILDRFGAGSTLRWVDVTNEFLGVKDCFSAAMTGNAAEVVTKCFDVPRLYEVFGPPGLILGVLVMAGEFVDFFRSEFNALFDQFDGRSNYRMTVTRTVATPATCSASDLFNAAVSAEHFNPKDPSYQQLIAVGNGPGATQVRCVGDWAVAMISRPNVGTTDGATLFQRQANGSWSEVAQTGAIVVCTLMPHGVPQDVALKLANGRTDSGSFC